MREFRRRKAEMEDQLVEMQQRLEDKEHEQQTRISLIEQRFFEEKVKYYTILSLSKSCT